jgi:hypothetical protein
MVMFSRIDLSFPAVCDRRADLQSLQPGCRRPSRRS